MSDTFQWQLTPAPGQFGAPKPEQQAQATPRESDDQDRPYGFSGKQSVVPYVPTAQNPALRDRPASEWGTDDWVLRGMDNYQGGIPTGMHVPTESDILPNIHNNAMFWGRWGPPSIGMPAIQAAQYTAQAQQAFNKGYREQAQLNWQQAQHTMQIQKYRQDEMLTQYSNAYEAWGPKVDANGKTTAGDTEKFRRRIEEVARSHGDTTVLRMLAEDDWPGLDNLMKSYDSHGQDLNKTAALLRIQAEQLKLKEAQEKSRQQEQQRKQWFGTPTPASPPATDQPQTAPTAPEAPAAPKPETTPDHPDATTETPDATPPTADTTTAAPTAPSYQVPLAPQRVNQAAQAAQMDGKPALPKDDAIRGAVEGQRERLDDYMHSLINDKGLKGDEVLARARAANPAMGDLVQGLLDGTTELTPTASAKPSMQIATQIARRIDPDFTRTAQKKKDQREMDARRAEIAPLRQALGQQEKMRSNIRDTVVKNVRDMDYLVRLARRLRERGLETQIPIVDDIVRRGRRTVTGDPDVAAFDAQLRNVRTDVGRILSTGSSGTGAVYPVSVQKEMREFFAGGISVPQLEATIAVIKRDYNNKLGPISDEINSLNGRIAQISGTQPPAPISDADIARELSAEETRKIGDKTYYRRNGKWYDE
jgi:hypothetical protein